MGLLLIPIRRLAGWARLLSVSRIVVKSPRFGRDNMCTTAGHPRSPHQGLLLTGEACSVGSESFHATPQAWGSRGGAQDEVTLQAVQRAPSVTSKRDKLDVKLKDHEIFSQCLLCLQLSVLCPVRHNRIHVVQDAQLSGSKSSQGVHALCSHS